MTSETGLSFLPASPEDARLVADVRTAEYPLDPFDPAKVELWFSNDSVIWDRFRVLSSGEAVGFMVSLHNPWDRSPDRVTQLRVGLRPEHRSKAALAAVYEFAEDRAAMGGAHRVSAVMPEFDRVGVTALTALGYQEDGRERFWELRLTGSQERILRLRAEASDRMTRAGITIATLAETRDADRLRQVHRMSSECELDVPSSEPILPDDFEHFQRWLATPFIHDDRIFVAWADGQPVGLSTLSFPVERGIVSTDWTCVQRDHRGRGIARALKLETLAQAIHLGVDRVRTDNDSRNAPILKLNSDLGYRHIHDALKMSRSLGKGPSERAGHASYR